MEVGKALAQLAEIHGHLAKTEVYRGCRSVPVALTGVLAVTGGWLQPWFVKEDSPLGFLAFWVGVASLSIALVSAEIGVNYWIRSGVAARRTTRKAVGQFLPCVAAGVIVTAGVVQSGAERIGLLPGLWAILFGLGIFAARPYLPRAIGWVALFYLAAGGILLWLGNAVASLSPWSMAFPFGVGQFLSALVLYWNLERKEDAWETTS